MSESMHILVDDPICNSTSFHNHQTSVPRLHMIELGSFKFKDTSRLHFLSTGSINHSLENLEVTFNIRILKGLLNATQYNVANGVNTFKIVGIVTC